MFYNMTDPSMMASAIRTKVVTTREDAKPFMDSTWHCRRNSLPLARLQRSRWAPSVASSSGEVSAPWPKDDVLQPGEDSVLVFMLASWFIVY